MSPAVPGAVRMPPSSCLTSPFSVTEAVEKPPTRLHELIGRCTTLSRFGTGMRSWMITEVADVLASATRQRGSSKVRLERSTARRYRWPMASGDTEEIARRVAAAYAALPGVIAVALGGSRSTGAAGEGSDLDLYVYADAGPPRDLRARVPAGAVRAEIGNRAFEPGDEWLDAGTGVHVDAMFRTRAWIEEELDRVLVRHEPRTGYSTALWHGVRTSRTLVDPASWYAALQ